MVEDAYRDLAEKAIEAQSNSASSLEALRTELAEIKASLAAIDSVLKAVE